MIEMLVKTDKFIAITSKGGSVGVGHISSNFSSFTCKVGTRMTFDDMFDVYKYFFNNLEKFIDIDINLIRMSFPNRCIGEFRFKNHALHTTKSKPSVYIQHQSGSRRMGNVRLYLDHNNKFKYEHIGVYKSAFVKSSFDLYSQYTGEIDVIDLIKIFPSSSYKIFLEKYFVVSNDSPVCIQSSKVWFKSIDTVFEWEKVKEHLKKTLDKTYLSYHSVPKDELEIALFEIGLELR